MAVAHFRHIADATDLPIIVFQYPLATGQGYPRDTLLRICDEVPSVRAIKDWCGNVPQHEMHVRVLQSRQRPVNVLSTHSAWLFSSLVLGCNGLLSGSGSVIADLQAALFRAVTANDLAEARRINDRIDPLARVFYREPWADMHNRMKEALVLLGRLPRAVVRPPLVKLASAEIEDIRRALIKPASWAANAAATPREVALLDQASDPIDDRLRRRIDPADQGGEVLAVLGLEIELALLRIGDELRVRHGRVERVAQHLEAVGRKIGATNGRPIPWPA